MSKKGARKKRIYSTNIENPNQKAYIYTFQFYIMNGKQFLLMLIGFFGCTMEGETRLQKLTFLAKEEYGIQLPFKFTWSNYGPFSGDVRDCLQVMEVEGLLEQKKVKRGLPTGSYMIHIFALTEKGKKELNAAKKEHQTENKIINSLIERFGRENLHDVLAYVYGRYEKTEEGEIIASDNFA